MKGLVDSTLREGCQMAGTAFTLAEKKLILSHLVRIGIEEIEIGIATPYDDDLQELRTHCRSLSQCGRIGLWCPCREENIDFALGLKPDVLSLSIPASDFLIRNKLKRDPAWVLRTVRESVAAAARSFPYVSLGLEDATRAEPEFLRALVLTAAAAGTARIRLADTLGIASPSDITALVQTVRSTYRGDLGVHLHNDFGMATANSIQALQAGADYADVTALGIGERAGNARLEEVVGFLALQKGRSYRTIALRPLAELMATLSGRQLDALQPVIGEHIFHCESGHHLQGLRRDWKTYEPFAPEQVGTKRRLLYGRKIGKGDIRDCLEPRGIQLESSQLEKLARELRRIAAERNHSLLQQEFASLVTSLI